MCRCIQRPVATLCQQDLGKQWYSINVELFCTAVNELNLNRKKKTERKKERGVGPLGTQQKNVVIRGRATTKFTNNLLF